LPYFRKLERFEPTGEIDPAFHGTSGPLTIAPLRSVNPMARVYLAAAAQAGIPFNPDFNGATQAGAGLYTFTQRNGERVTAEGAYLDPIRHRPNLHVLSERTVTKILFQGKRATAIAFDSATGQGTIPAREIILSAGSFVSPHLLLLSGIGDKAQLQRHGITPIQHLPGVGENLQDHLDVTLEYRAKSTAPYGISWRALPRNILHVLDWLFRRRGLFASTTGEGGAFLSTVPGQSRPDIQLFFCTAIGNTQNAGGFTGHGFLMHVCQLRPTSIGRVSLTSADPHAKPSILYNFLRNDGALEVLRAGIRLARTIIAQPQFARHLDREVDPGPDEQSDGALDAFIRRSVGTLFHPVGTCAMGTGPDAVVDSTTLRVHGVTGPAHCRCLHHAHNRFRQHGRRHLLPRRKGRRPHHKGPLPWLISRAKSPSSPAPPALAGPSPSNSPPRARRSWPWG
jgi:choline dehydrogenase